MFAKPSDVKGTFDDAKSTFEIHLTWSSQVALTTDMIAHFIDIASKRFVLALRPNRPPLHTLVFAATDNSHPNSLSQFRLE
jgi:hypothetical protein